jgi:hypothetical protein
MKQFLEKKEKGFFCSAVSVVLFAIGLVFYRMLTAVSFETTERPLTVVLFTFGTILFSLIASYKDFGKVPSIAAYALATVAFFALLEGRASYLAFFFAGDVMNTGLSSYMVIAITCYFLGMVAALLAVIFEEDKGGHPKFEAADWKVILPMVCVIVILTIIVGLNTNGSKAEPTAVSISVPAEKNGTVSENDASAAEAVTETISNYKTPTEPEEKWQGYTGEQYYNEDNDKKAIAYQLIGHGEVDAGQPAVFDALINLYEDGEMVMSVFGRGNAYQYFGYWTNVNDENLWFCVMDYMVVGMDQICTIDYSYDLTGHFDDITVNVALGLADGGKFVRNIPAGGDGRVLYPSIREWFSSFGYDMPEKTFGSDTSQEAEILFSFTSDSENYLLDIYNDCTYTFTFKTAGLVETGTWDYHEWKMTLTDKNGKVTEVDKDNPEHEMRLHFVAAVDERVSRDFTAPSSAWGVAFKGQGDYDPPEGLVNSVPANDSDADASLAEKQVLFSFISDSENYLLDINTDNTYTFTFKTAGLVEEGTWDYHGWKMTLTDKNGKVTEVDKDNPEHEMRLHFVAAVDERVNRDFTAPSSAWGVAFKGQGDYPVE